MGKIMMIAGIAVAVISTVILIVFSIRPLRYEPTIYSAANVAAAKPAKKEAASQHVSAEKVKENKQSTGTRIMGAEDEKTAVLHQSSSEVREEKTQVLTGNMDDKTRVLGRKDEEETQVLSENEDNKTRVLSRNLDYEADQPTRVLTDQIDDEGMTRVLGQDEDKTQVLNRN